jgi:O-acetyl-ADP-ribose deacetylase (regulator of RNase III)
MKTIQGDLIRLALDGEFDVIAQGCNCMCQMGRGIALTIKLIFPEAYAADLLTTKGDASKLGSITSADVTLRGKPLTIVNCYTQYNYTGEGVLAQYDAIEAAMLQIKAQYSGKKIGLPKIGAGLARGDWSIIEPIIANTLSDEDVTVVLFTEN